MPLATNLKRYKDIARLLVKYGRAAAIERSELDELVADPDAAGEAVAEPKAEELANDLEALGPTFVKLGQILSTRADLLPVPYLEALSRLQDNVDPFPFSEVEAIVQQELGVRLSKAFTEFDPQPLAAASLGQVHRAALRDGRAVAVKVQRPGIRETIAEDLEALAQAAELADKHTAIGRRYRFSELVEEFRRSLVRELDYRQEAENLRLLGTNLERFPRLVVPQPVEAYSTSRVLTMDYVRGRKITDVGPMARLDIDGEALADELFRAYLHQILVDGIFHADPHPGNVFITEDGRLALLDLGMVGRLTPAMQEKLLKLVLAIADGRGEEAAATIAGMSEKLDGFDERALVRAVSTQVSAHRGAKVSDLQVGRLVLQVSHDAGTAGVRVPPELALLGKTLLHLDEIGRSLAPQFDPNAAIRRHAAEITSERMRRSASPSHIFAALSEFKEFVEQLPARANKILDLVANNEMRVKVETIDERLVVEGAQKIANRITLGLILAALIVGAALLMQIQTSFRILGYPGLAMLCFLGAAAGGLVLILNILVHDRRTQRK